MAKKGQKNGTKKPLDHSVQDADGGSNDLDPGKPRQLSFYLSVAVLVLGIAIALYLKRRDVQVQLEKLDQHYQLNVKPQLEQLEQELLSRLNETIPLAYFTQQSNRPGYHLAKEGAKAKYPVVMIPGFVTSGLEVSLESSLWQAGFSSSFNLSCHGRLLAQHMYTTHSSSSSSSSTGMGSQGLRQKTLSSTVMGIHWNGTRCLIGTRLLERTHDA